jgi:hypothetical protein
MLWVGRVFESSFCLGGLAFTFCLGLAFTSSPSFLPSQKQQNKAGKTTINHQEQFAGHRQRRLAK